MERLIVLKKWEEKEEQWKKQCEGRSCKVAAVSYRPLYHVIRSTSQIGNTLFSSPLSFLLAEETQHDIMLVKN
jgi:hypothetical protein